MTTSPDIRSSQPMTAFVEAQFSLSPGCGIIFDDFIEVSLDCPVCLRTGRTVDFRGIAGKSTCTPIRHSFPGVLEDISRGGAEGHVRVEYRLSYQHVEFVDSKRNEPSVPHPTWARVHFQLACPTCGTRNARSTQNNIVRPFTHRCERCHTSLWVDSEEIPQFRLVDEDGNVIYRQDRSTFSLYLADFDGLPPSAWKTLEQATKLDAASLSARARRHEPLFEQHAYGLAEPLRFSEKLQDMAFALLDAGATFRLLHNGRDIRQHYVDRLMRRRP